MKTYRELVYMVLDELKVMSDDATFTSDHIIFMLSNFRAFLLKQRYSDIRKEIPSSNYQTLCLNLQEHNSIEGLPCEGTYMRSIEKIPDTINISSPIIHPIDYFKGEISYVSPNRFKYVGFNKWLKNMIYATLGTNNYLCLKSNNPQLYYMEEIQLTGVFSDAAEASKLECDTKDVCDILDKNFPLEEALIPPIIELCVKELSGALYRPKDEVNNAKDDLVANQKQQ